MSPELKEKVNTALKLLKFLPRHHQLKAESVVEELVSEVERLEKEIAIRNSVVQKPKRTKEDKAVALSKEYLNFETSVTKVTPLGETQYTPTTSEENKTN